MAYLGMLARFNRWTNQRIYDCVAELDEADYRRDRGAFFGSIHNTLNHLMVIDRLWRGRLEDQDLGVRSLDQIFYDDFEGLREARRAEDAALIAVVDGLSDAQLGAITAYRGSDGVARELRTDLILVTLYNHQTHHRGQVHCMLTQNGIIPPSLDVPTFINESR